MDIKRISRQESTKELFFGVFLKVNVLKSYIRSYLFWFFLLIFYYNSIFFKFVAIDLSQNHTFYWIVPYIQDINIFMPKTKIVCLSSTESWKNAGGAGSSKRTGSTSSCIDLNSKNRRWRSARLPTRFVTPKCPRNNHQFCTKDDNRGSH